MNSLIKIISILGLNLILILFAVNEIKASDLDRACRACKDTKPSQNQCCHNALSDMGFFGDSLDFVEYEVLCKDVDITIRSIDPDACENRNLDLKDRDTVSDLRWCLIDGVIKASEDNIEGIKAAPKALKEMGILLGEANLGLFRRVGRVGKAAFSPKKTVKEELSEIYSEEKDRLIKTNEKLDDFVANLGEMVSEFNKDYDCLTPERKVIMMCNVLGYLELEVMLALATSGVGFVAKTSKLGFEVQHAISQAAHGMGLVASTGSKVRRTTYVAEKIVDKTTDSTEDALSKAARKAPSSSDGKTRTSTKGRKRYEPVESFASDAERLAEARRIIGKDLTPEQIDAIQRAHAVPSKTYPIDPHGKAAQAKKGILRQHFSHEEAMNLMDRGVAGAPSRRKLTAAEIELGLKSGISEGDIPAYGGRGPGGGDYGGGAPDVTTSGPSERQLRRMQAEGREEALRSMQETSNPGSAQGPDSRLAGTDIHSGPDKGPRDVTTAGPSEAKNRATQAARRGTEYDAPESRGSGQGTEFDRELDGVTIHGSEAREARRVAQAGPSEAKNRATQAARRGTEYDAPESRGSGQGTEFDRELDGVTIHGSEVREPRHVVHGKSPEPVPTPQELATPEPAWKSTSRPDYATNPDGSRPRTRRGQGMIKETPKNPRIDEIQSRKAVIDKEIIKKKAHRLHAPDDVEAQRIQREIDSLTEQRSQLDAEFEQISDAA
ncbi:MAG: hypothetical protein ABIA04_00145 [Pseudomonadota bacterium]